MARWFGMMFAVLLSGLMLSSVDAQDPAKGTLDVEAVFKKLDANSDGKLHKDEFLRLADRFKDKEKARAKLTMTYNAIDPKNMGLSKDQFRKYLDGVKKKDETPR